MVVCILLSFSLKNDMPSRHLTAIGIGHKCIRYIKVAATLIHYKLHQLFWTKRSKEECFLCD